MIDVEFVVQFLILAYAAQHPSLCDNVGNIALLHRAQHVQLLTEEIAQQAAHAYRQLRKVQHQARLNESPTQVPSDLLVAPQQAIQALWQQVFGPYTP